jgi:hypothetical protein
MVIFNNYVENDLLSMAKALHLMNMEELTIVSIISDATFEYEITQVEQIKYIEMGLMYFVNNYLENVDPTHF